MSSSRPVGDRECRLHCSHIELMFLSRTLSEAPMALSSEMEPADFVASLARGLAVIRAFGHDAHEMTLTEVARRTGLTRATARRR